MAFSTWSILLLTLATAFANPLPGAAPYGKAKHSAKLTGRHPIAPDEAVIARRNVRTANYTAPLTKLVKGSYYSLDVLWGDQTLPVLLDTGSSDLWVAASNFTCTTYNGTIRPLSDCGFGAFLTQASFPPGQKIPNEKFDVGYGDGQIKGIVGYEDIAIGGLTVAHQEVAIAYSGTFYSDGVLAGIFGLNYPQSTSAYAGRNPYKPGASRNYNPFFFEAFTRGLIEPVFSLALERGANNEDAGGGQIAWGGLPDIEFPHEFVTEPFRGEDDYRFQVEGWVLNGEFMEESTRESVYNIDSGNPLLQITTSIADKICAAYDPPTYVPEGTHQQRVDCNATAPDLAIRIAGKDFPIDKRDLVLPALEGYRPREKGYCVSAVQPSGRILGLQTLGQPLLKNVVAVFDVGASQFSFAPHVY